MTGSADEPTTGLGDGSRLLLAIGGIGMVVVSIGGLAFAGFWALLSAAPVGSFLGPSSESEQTTGVLFAIVGALLAGSAFAAGLALLMRSVAQRWPSNTTLLVPPVVAFILVVAVALFSSSAG